jgi:hypothetical protein
VKYLRMGVIDLPLSAPRVIHAVAIAVVACVSLASGVLVQAQGSIFFVEDWESGFGRSFNSRYYGNTGGSQFQLQESVAAEGRSALEHRIPAGAEIQYATQHFADAHQQPSWSARAGEHLMDLYVQYKVYYSPNWDISQIPKQLIIGTEDDRRHENACCNPWVANYLTIFPPFGTDDRNAEVNNKQAASGQWIVFRQNASGYGGSNRFGIRLGRWYTVEVRRRLNDMGADNGIFQMWIDGVLLFDYRNVRYRTPWNGTFGTTSSYGTNFVMISDYVGGGRTTTTESVYYDDIKLSGSYIGVSRLPSQPTNLRLIPGEAGW